MDLEKVIFERRTVRRFKEIPVEKEKIELLIDAAIHAPSASNKQAWKFIVVNDSKIKEQICKCNGSVVNVGSDILYKAPCGILVLYRNDVSKNYKLYKDTIQSAAAAIQNILLMAYNLGLGGCWICKLPTQKKIRKILEIPSKYDIIAYVALGYPHENLDDHTLRHFDNDLVSANYRKRKYSINEVTSYNKYENKNECNEVYKFVNAVCLLQSLQLNIKKGKNGILVKLTRTLLKLLGEKWV